MGFIAPDRTDQLTRVADNRKKIISRRVELRGCFLVRLVGTDRVNRRGKICGGGAFSHSVSHSYVVNSTIPVPRSYIPPTIRMVPFLAKSSSVGLRRWMFSTVRATLVRATAST